MIEKSVEVLYFELDNFISSSMSNVRSPPQESSHSIMGVSHMAKGYIMFLFLSCIFQGISSPDRIGVVM